MAKNTIKVDFANNQIIIDKTFMKNASNTNITKKAFLFDFFLVLGIEVPQYSQTAIVSSISLPQ